MFPFRLFFQPKETSLSDPNNTVASDRTTDAVHLFSAAEASILGDPWLLVIGCDHAHMAEVLSNSVFDALTSTERITCLKNMKAEIDHQIYKELQSESAPTTYIPLWTGTPADPGWWETQFSVEAGQMVPLISIAKFVELLGHYVRGHGRGLAALAKTHPSLAQISDDFASTLGMFDDFVDQVDRRPLPLRGTRRHPCRRIFD